MEKKKIIALLNDFDQGHVEKFASYCLRLFLEKNRDGIPKNQWIQNKKESDLAQLFKRVNTEGLVFDGVHITLQKTGVSYDYQAYKNKMYLAYPESKIDVQLVYSGDEFAFEKQSGSVAYKHVFSDPFNQKDQDIIGGYCVIKNKRGEFLTILSRDRIDLHRHIAKTDSIWKAWFPEMCLKTVIKKACKTHFEDVYRGIEEMDNDNYDLEKAVQNEKPGVTASQKKEKDPTLEDLHKEYMVIFNEYQEKHGEEKASPFHPDNWRTEKNMAAYKFAIKSLGQKLKDGNN